MTNSVEDECLSEATPLRENHDRQHYFNGGSSGNHDQTTTTLIQTPICRSFRNYNNNIGRVGDHAEDSQLTEPQIDGNYPITSDGNQVNNNCQGDIITVAVSNPEDHYKYHKMDDSKKVLMKVVTDLVLLMCVGFPILFYFLWGEPYHRGFFCDDESLKHPFHDSTIKNYYLYIFGLIIPIALITLVEVIHARKSNGRNENRLTVLNRRIPNWLKNAYKQIGVFGFGAACSQLTTDIAKYEIGRLRPHFFSVCDPHMPNNTTCADPINQGRYVEDFVCGMAGTASDRILKEVRLSFPSGHASFSAYTMVYCAIFIQCRMTWRWSRLPKHIIQFVLIMFAWFTSLSRISDYKHHWSDAMAGTILGTTVAIVIAAGVSDLFSARRKNAQNAARSSDVADSNTLPNGNNGIV